MRHPTLILATTGTTSSGKSTLVNFLCGADIVPTAVSEMSAGAVTIEYSQEKTLIIEETPGALWECGKWPSIPESEIYRLLEQVMLAYIDNKKDNPSLAYPKFLIYYPFRLLKEYERNLPRGVRVKMLDLPGLSYVGDESNMEVIKQCREALCLVTYNSQETDPQKIKSLLLQVVEEVKGLGGSPKRMLFILNKIDVFRNDRNWTESEKRFVEKTTNSIKNELTEQLGEYKKDIEELKIIKLSTLPALLALQIQSSNRNDSNIACRDADLKCGQLIEENILEDLPRKAENWSSQDRIRVAEDLWQKSYAEEFQQYLNQHISQHFPKLVIPQAIERFKVAAGNSIEQWAVQTTTAILNSSEENYQQESEKISWIKTSLEQFLEVSDANLRKPFEEMNQKCEDYFNKPFSEDLVRILEGAVEELQNTPPYNEIEEKLIPLYNWREALGRGVDQILEAVAESLDNGIVNLDHPNFKKVDTIDVNLLEKNLMRLISLGYRAKNGQIIEAKTQEEKDNLNYMNLALEELSLNLSKNIAQVLENISQQEINRMYNAVFELFQCHLSYLEEEANRIAPDIAIKFPSSKLNQVTKELRFNPQFESGFDITAEEYTVKYRTWRHWLGIVRKKETHYSDNATIPSTGEMLEDWQKQLKKSEPEMLKRVMEWLLEQINDLKKKVNKTQGEILDLYQDRLEKARQEITIDYEKQKNIWEPMQDKAHTLATHFSQISPFLEEENLSD
ncbi:dynamin family protein [Crocosphaera watsonii]|uniref:dynamin family protein n=1 Tax=Crocosphaera watsonii TaxID=263511 RepID=UPI0030D94703